MAHNLVLAVLITIDNDHVSNCDPEIRVNYDYEVTLELDPSYKITLERLII